MSDDDQLSPSGVCIANDFRSNLIYLMWKSVNASVAAIEGRKIICRPVRN